MLEFLAGTAAIIALYCVVGYLLAIIFIARHKAGGKLAEKFMDGGENYEGLIILWPLALGILGLLVAASVINVVKAPLAKIDFGRMKPEAVVDGVRDRNKLTIIIEGKESHDG